MSRSHGKRRQLATLLLPLLAASLACNALGGAGTPVIAPLTQAASTTTAAARLAAASTTAPTPPPAAATAAAQPTPAATATLAPAEAAAPTAAPTLAANSTAVLSATAAVTTSAAVVLDPCTLLTPAQAQSLTGVPMGTPKKQNGACLIADASTGASTGVIIYALPASQSQAFLNQFVPSLKSSGVNVDPALAAKLNQDLAAGDTVAAVNDLVAMTANQPKFKAHPVDGIGSVALWSWNKVLTSQQGLLVAARPGVLVALALIAGGSTKETDAQPVMQQIVTGVLAGLPPNFTVAGLQVAGSAPALDPCSLASASDISPLMGAKSDAGLANQGKCNFLDVASHKLMVHVYALPAGAAASNAVTGVALTMLIGNQTGQDKVTVDLAAGDLVAAVTDLGASVRAGANTSLAVTHGLGDSGFLFIQTVGAHRVGYFLAANPGVLVGIETLLGPGDNTATSTLARALLSRILTNLPASFTVNGVP